jgi:hypothetical protein
VGYGLKGGEGSLGAESNGEVKYQVWLEGTLIGAGTTVTETIASALVAVQRDTNKGVVVHIVHRARILINKLGCAFFYGDRKIMSAWPILSCTIVATKSHKIQGYAKKEEKMEKR